MAMAGASHRARCLGLAVALALFGGETAEAQCADAAVVSAARLHEFEMLMMDVSMRCYMMGVDMRPHYDAMVTTHRPIFDGAAQQLRHFFGADVPGAARHGTGYDRYATLIANKYGAGNTSLDHCRVFDAIAVELTQSPEGPRELDTVARAMIEHPSLEQASCVPER